jgi:hypothetical protein
MTKDFRKNEIATRLWQRKAAELRTAVQRKLKGAPSSFLSQQESFAFGKSYWTKADELVYSDPDHVNAILREFRISKKTETVYWLHELTNDCGILVMKVKDVLSAATDAQGNLHQDLLMAAPHLGYGICFELGEGDNYLRYWGV